MLIDLIDIVCEIRDAFAILPKITILALFCENSKRLQCVKSACIWSFSGLHFPAFRLNTEHSVQMQENTDQQNSYSGKFSRNAKNASKPLHTNKQKIYYGKK